MRQLAKQWVSGKIGEWLQGIDKNGDPIVFPLTITSSPFRTVVRAERNQEASIAVESQSPETKRKTESAIAQMAATCGFANACGYRITILGTPPEAKGLGSSSIDIASALLAIKDDRNLDISNTALFQIMCRVERSDFLFSPESIVATNPVTGDFSIVGPAPSCVVIAWDSAPSARIDTEAVLHLDEARQPFSNEYEHLSSLLRSSDLETMGYASTRSAEINDQLLPKPGFSVAQRLRKDFRAVGLVAAHTGTYLGLLFGNRVDPALLAELSATVINEFSVAPVLFGVGGAQGGQK